LLQAPAEIYALLRPNFSKLLHPSIFDAQALLAAFLPTRGVTTEKATEWIRDWLRLWRGVESVAAWDTGWLDLLSKLARDTQGTVDWLPFLPEIYTHLLRMMQLPTDAAIGLTPCIVPNSASALKAQKLDKFSYAAKMLVYMLPGEPGPVLEEQLRQLRRLFAQLDTHYHPSNQGSWTTRVAYFLQCVAYSLAKRHGKRGSGGNPVFAQSTLEAMEGILHRPIQLCLFSKSSFARTCANQVLLTPLLPFFMAATPFHGTHMAELTPCSCAGGASPQLPSPDYYTPRRARLGGRRLFAGPNPTVIAL